MNRQPDYKFRFSATSLDAFQEFLDTTAEEFFYQDEGGAWHLNYDEATGSYFFSDEEVQLMARQCLIDKINRVEKKPSEAADKGTALNEIVDCLLENRKPEDGVSVTRLYEWIDGMQTDRVVGLQGEINGFKFPYDLGLCNQIKDYFHGSVCQYLTSAPIETDFGLVELYGYADYVRCNKVYDLKTTKQYKFGKFERKWQKHVYPFALLTSGMCTEISEFEYTCFVLSGGNSRSPLITGMMYPEVYSFDYNSSKALLVEHCNKFCEFLLANKEYITDKKIFGGTTH